MGNEWVKLSNILYLLSAVAASAMFDMSNAFMPTTASLA